MNIQFTVNGPENNCVFTIDYKSITERLSLLPRQKYFFRNTEANISMEIMKGKIDYIIELEVGDCPIVFFILNKIIDELIIVNGITYQQYNDKNNINISITTT